jgi:hypothetical protein
MSRDDRPPQHPLGRLLVEELARGVAFVCICQLALDRR